MGIMEESISVLHVTRGSVSRTHCTLLLNVHCHAMKADVNMIKH